MKSDTDSLNIRQITSRDIWGAAKAFVKTMSNVDYESGNYSTSKSEEEESNSTIEDELEESEIKDFSLLKRNIDVSKGKVEVEKKPAGRRK